MCGNGAILDIHSINNRVRKSGFGLPYTSFGSWGCFLLTLPQRSNGFVSYLLPFTSFLLTVPSQEATLDITVNIWEKDTREIYGQKEQQASPMLTPTPKENQVRSGMATLLFPLTHNVALVSPLHLFRCNPCESRGAHPILSSSNQPLFL